VKRTALAAGYFFNTSTIVLPSRAGEDETLIPATSMAAISIRHRHYFGHQSQFSVRTPGIRANSRMLFVTTISPSLRA
jgi:hypothetical protein